MTRRCHDIIACAAVLLAMQAARAQAAERLRLSQDGKPTCVIVRDRGVDYPAERLVRWFKEVADTEVPCVLAAGGDARPDAATVRLRIDDKALGRVDGGPLIRQQSYIIRTSQDGPGVLELIGGGADGLLHAVADLINWHLRVDEDGVSVGAIEVREAPRYAYRWFWTWDHRMDWGGPGKPGTLMGGGGTFAKKPKAFLIDYKRCIDYMADHKFNGLIIWGFLRDTHGGVEATKELCRYASRRGVRILPGVGTSGYAGYYFEGDHPYNANTWLKQHPELKSITREGKPRNAPCPSKKANQDWLDDGARWLFRTFDIGGVNLEMGDYFVCYCDDCKKARAAIESDEPDYYKDMAISHMVTLKTMRQLAPDGWLSYATYTGYKKAMMTDPPKFLSMIPQDAICQWTLTRMARKWPADVKPMAKHNVGYLHWCNSSTHTEDDFYLHRVRDICRNAASVGFEGLDTYGELPDTKPNAEIVYLAWEAWLWNPDMTVEQFVDQRLGRLYGGAIAARKLLEIMPLVRTNADRTDPAKCARGLELAKQARSTADASGHARWDRLIAELSRHEQTARQAMEAKRQREAAARAGTKVAVLNVEASDAETGRKNWPARKAIDGSVAEPAGYWLTTYSHPKSAWLELTLVEPSQVNLVSIYHQVNPAHYRSLDYTISVRIDGKWKRVASVKGNKQAGWRAHRFDTVTTDAVRLDITKSAYGNRMGVGEIEVRYAE